MSIGSIFFKGTCKWLQQFPKCLAGTWVLLPRVSHIAIILRQDAAPVSQNKPLGAVGAAQLR